MVGQYLWGTLKSHKVMDEFLWEKFRQNPEVAPHKILYLFDYLFLRVEVVELRQKVELQSNNVSNIEKTCK